MLSGNSLRQTVHTHRASVHPAAIFVAALLRVARVTAGLVESNGSLALGLWLTAPAGWLPRTRISSGTLRSVIEYGLTLLFYVVWCWVQCCCVQGLIESCSNDTLTSDSYVRLVCLFDNEEVSHSSVHLLKCDYCITFGIEFSIIENDM